MNTCGPVTELAEEIWRAIETVGTADLEVQLRPHTRLLVLGRTTEDQITRDHSRLFVLPDAAASDVTLEIEKLGGRARATFNVCKIDRNMQVENVWRLDLASGTRNRRKRFTRTLDHLEGYLLSVYAEVGTLQTLHYSLTLRRA